MNYGLLIYLSCLAFGVAWLLSGLDAAFYLVLTIWVLVALMRFDLYYSQKSENKENQL